MDDDGLSIRNWGYYEPSPRGHLGLNLMPTMSNRDIKPFLSGREDPIMVNPNSPFQPRDSMLSDPPVHVDYLRDSWINHRDKYFQMLPETPSFAFLSEPSEPPVMHNFEMPDKELEEEASVDPMKKRTGGTQLKTPKGKKTKRGVKENGNTSGQRSKAGKKNIEVVINGVDLDFTGIPIPVCSCTGSPQQCYRWGCGGWQSACCTTTISMYPLPMSTKRRGARIAGRKMSQGAFKKVLEKLASEKYDFDAPIDLRTHWAKHGTNKFVTIR
jgi:hypothetical protein